MSNPGRRGAGSSPRPRALAAPYKRSPHGRSPDAVPDDVWDAAAEHFDETQLGALVLDIAQINVWNRLNVATRQIVGEQSW